jgi:hypothetical protein
LGGKNRLKAEHTVFSLTALRLSNEKIDEGMEKKMSKRRPLVSPGALGGLIIEG